MIQKFVDRFMASDASIREEITAFIVSDVDYLSYAALVKIVVGHLAEPEDYGEISARRIHCIDDGDYQGTLVFVIGANGYQPDDYWYVTISYGSCSGCDTLEALSDYEYNHDYTQRVASERQLDGIMTLALHIVQRLKKMGDDE